MPDLEKVLQGLECCSKYTGNECQSCPYEPVCKPKPGERNPLMMDAIALLKAQEPRLITQDEFFNHPDRSAQGCLPLWYEEKSGKQGWCFVYYLAENPGEEKRYWTSRPTNEQREAAPWGT